MGNKDSKDMGVGTDPLLLLLLLLLLDSAIMDSHEDDRLCLGGVSNWSEVFVLLTSEADLVNDGIFNTAAAMAA